MKIVMLTDVYDERMQYQDNLFAKYYCKHGHEVTVVASTINNTFDYYAGRERYDPRAPAREYRDGNATVIKQPYAYNVLNRLRKLKDVRPILERERPDLIFSHDIHLNLPDAVWYRRRHPHCRIILDYHADFSNSGRNWVSILLLHKLTRKRVLDRCASYIDRIFPVVPASADFLHSVYGVPHDRMELLPLGADTDLARATREGGYRKEIRQRLGIPKDAWVVFTGGKLTPAKRTHLLLEAVRSSGTPNLHVLVVGEVDADASHRHTLTNAAAGDPRIHFVGWVGGDEVYQYMSACDLAVFPASQSVLWQQALSMGLPLIVGRVGVQDPSYMNVYDNMIILDEARITADEIARAVRSLIDDPAKLAQRQAAALRTADELLNYHRLVEQTLRPVNAPPGPA